MAKKYRITFKGFLAVKLMEFDYAGHHYSYHGKKLEDAVERLTAPGGPQKATTAELVVWGKVQHEWGMMQSEDKAKQEPLKGRVRALMLWLVILAICGCGISRYTAESKASYKDGEWKWSSEKDYGKFRVEITKTAEQITEVKIYVDEAKTSEDALSAMSKAQLMFAEVLQKMVPLIEKAAMAAS